MKDNKKEKLKGRLGIVTVCCFCVSAISLLNIYSKISLLTTIYEYAEGEVQEMADLAGGILGYVMVFFIMLILGFMLLRLNKSGKPFSRSNIRKIQVIAWLTWGCAILPSVLSSVIVFVCNDSAIFLDYGVHEICMMFLGSALFVISEIFHYGNELQDDVDLIA